jgi:uncharacterized protein YjbI with pentapeptide repeats
VPEKQEISFDHDISDEELAKILAEHNAWLESEGASGSQADLRHVVQLKRGRLAGANLDGVILPETLTWSREREHVEQIVAIARPLYWVLLIVSVYSMSVLTSTDDISILTDTRIKFIPESAIGIPVSRFFTGLPIILFGFYIYLHLYLYRAWRVLSYFPSVFQDGTPLHQAVSPWLPVALVRFYQLHGVRRPSPMALAQKWITIALVWWLPPTTLALFWARYVVRHDWAATLLHVVLAAAAIWSAVVLYRIAVATMRRDRNPFSSTQGKLWSAGMALGISAFFLLLSLGSINTAHYDVASSSPIAWFGRILNLVGIRNTAELAGADLQNANLSGADLRGANLVESNLENADLSNADLRRANLREAKLKAANLSYARLENATLWRVDLLDGNLSNADLRGAVLINANLWRADVRSADLTEATLNGARLAHAKFANANLRLADLSDTNLKGADLLRADLRGTDLSGSELDGANLFGARMHEADILGSVFNGVNFSNSTGLTQDQLDQACGSNVRGLASDLKIKPCPK